MQLTAVWLGRSVNAVGKHNQCGGRRGGGGGLLPLPRTGSPCHQHVHRTQGRCVPMVRCSCAAGRALHCTALHCTALHCTALHCAVAWHPSLGSEGPRRSPRCELPARPSAWATARSPDPAIAHECQTFNCQLSTPNHRRPPQDLFVSPARLIKRQPGGWYEHSGLWK